MPSSSAARSARRRRVRARAAVSAGKARLDRSCNCSSGLAVVITSGDAKWSAGGMPPTTVGWSGCAWTRVGMTRKGRPLLGGRPLLSPCALVLLVPVVSSVVGGAAADLEDLVDLTDLAVLADVVDLGLLLSARLRAEVSGRTEEPECERPDRHIRRCRERGAQQRVVDDADRPDQVKADLASECDEQVRDGMAVLNEEHVALEGISQQRCGSHRGARSRVL